MHEDEMRAPIVRTSSGEKVNQGRFGRASAWRPSPVSETITG